MTQKYKSEATRLLTSRASISLAALALLAGTVIPAYATINNTVTVTGTSPGGTPGDVTNTADETVDVEDANPVITTGKSASIVDSSGNPVVGSVSEGDVITYTFTATNDGNQTLTNVSMADPHDASVSGALSTITFVASPLTDNGTTLDSTDDGLDNVWDELAPGDAITWQATYTVTQADIISQVGDGSIDNTATASATAPGGVAGAITDDSDAVSIAIDAVDASLAVTKVADDDTEVVVGQTITYTYVVTNDGNVPITNIGLVDDVTAGSGADPVPTLGSLTNTSGNSSDDGLDNVVDTLAPGDTAEFTGTYVVTQSDIDNLQ